MKTNSTNKIGSFFENVKAEAIHDALKSNNYKGIRRDQIENLLKTKNINEAYKILKSKYKKNNLLLINSLILITSVISIISIIGFQIYQNKNFEFKKYLNFENYNNFLIIDFIFIFILLISVIFFILFVYQIVMNLKIKK